MTQMFTKQNISYGLIAIALIGVFIGVSAPPKNRRFFYITSTACFVAAMFLMFSSSEKFQHPSTHKVVVENENGNYIYGLSNDLSKYTPMEIPKKDKTPYDKDCEYNKEIAYNLYEGFEGQEEDTPETDSQVQLPDNVTPVTNMTQPDIDDETFTYRPRIIKALPNKRNRGQGDPIRGDLAIMPEPCGWFRPSASPNIDLRQGALNVIAGEDNEQGKALTNLINQTSGSSCIAGKKIDEPQLVVGPADKIYAA